MDNETVLRQAEYAQPLCTVLQIALVDLLESLAIKPSAVVGHSSGEIAAAYAVGSLTKQEAVIASFYRGFICKKGPKTGGMAAIGLGKPAVLPFLAFGVGIACENSGSSLTLSGNIGSLDMVLASIKKKNEHALVRKLKVEMAYHSSEILHLFCFISYPFVFIYFGRATLTGEDQMHLIGKEYYELLSKHVHPRSPIVPFYSSVHGGKVLSEACDFGPDYWQKNLEQPVLFHAAVKAMLNDNSQLVHLEIGPHSTLQGPLRQIYQETSISAQYISTLRRGENNTISLLSAVGQLYTAGVRVSVPYDANHASVLTNMPTYPWHYDREYWSETRVMKNWKFRKHAPNDLLGVRTLEGTDIEPTWRSNIRTVNIPWLRDHCIGDDIIFPAAAYIAMAGEAVFQTETMNSTRDYTVKHVDFRQALVLHQEHATELVTTLRPQKRPATTNKTAWYEFNIVSYDGTAWNEHCTGFVSSGRGSALPTWAGNTPEPLPRKVSSPRWYKTMARVGFNYGPQFTGLENISAGVTEKIAVADIVDHPGGESESLYSLHPTTLDLVLQTWTVAAFQGHYRDLKDLYLPTFIEELYVGDGAGKSICLQTTTVGEDPALGQSYGIDKDGHLVLLMKGLRTTRLESDNTAPELKALQLQWKPDINFLDASTLTRPAYDTREQLVLIERLFVLCAIESNREIQGIHATQPHFEHYRQWLAAQCRRFQQPDYPLVGDSLDLVNLPVTVRRGLIPEALEQCKLAGCGAVATAVWRSYDQLVNIFTGKANFLDMLLHDGILSAIYDWTNAIWNVAAFFQLLGHSQPQMRILEIGAGTGGLTAKILAHLQSQYGERLYLQYVFTDISPGFFVAAQERFKDFDGIEYKVLDISKDPVGQGFRLGEYDLIIASNVCSPPDIITST
jgi:malonyl CoA-acyl carrier protein transacylase